MSKSDLIISKPTIRTKEQLQRLQALPLEQKISLTQRRIEQFYTELDGKIYISFSGGKDSTVLLHIARQLFPDIKATFCDTGLEYPEIKSFVKSIENVEWLRPKMQFNKVIEKYGYPVISKKVSMAVSRYKKTGSEEQRQLRAVGGINPTSGKKQDRTIPLQYQWLINAPFDVSERCCDIMKKSPFKLFNKKTGLYPITGEMSGESRIREEQWIKNGCNGFDLGIPKSTPMAFWNDKDIWTYIERYNVKYSEIYNMGEVRTGCMFCLYGCQFDDSGGRPRFDRMKINHPKQYALCEKMGVIDVLHYLDKKLGRDQLELF